MTKVKNKLESYLAFGEVNILNRAMNLAYFDMLGDAGAVNHEIEKYNVVTTQQIQETAQRIFSTASCNTIYYFAEN